MKQALLTISILFVALTASARKYHDAAAFELYGHVKTSQALYDYNKEHGGSVYGSVYKFTQDGANEDWLNGRGSVSFSVTRNSEGFPTQLVKKLDKKNRETQKFYYDASGRLVKVERKVEYQPSWPTTINTFTYSGNNMTHESSPNVIVSNPNEEYDYYDIVTDAHGNWTRRSCSRDGKPYRIETRKITYWPETQKSAPKASTTTNAKATESKTKPASANFSSDKARQSAWHALWTRLGTCTFDQVSCRKGSSESRNIGETISFNLRDPKIFVYWNNRPGGVSASYSGHIDGDNLILTSKRQGQTASKASIRLHLDNVEKRGDDYIITITENGKTTYKFKTR